MKKTTIRILSLALCVLFVLGMAGCGKAKTSSEANSDTIDSNAFLEFDNEKGEGIKNNTSSTEKRTDSKALNASEGVTVTEKVKLDGDDPFANIPKKLRGTTVVFAHFGDEGATEYQKVCKAFTKKTGIKVKLLSYDQDAYIATVSKQIAARSAPDVIICNETFPHALEIAQPIQNLLDLNESFWDSSVTKATTIGGNTYFVNSLKGVWHNIDMIFYNKKIFSENSLRSPADYYKSGEWTYENLRKCLEDVKATGNVGGYVDPKMMAASMGSALVSYNSDTKTFAQNVKNAIPAYQYSAYNATNGLWDHNLWFGIFNNGTIGLYHNSAYGCKYNGWFEGIDASMVGAVPTPSSYNGKPCKQTENMRAYGLSKGAKNPEGAAYFLRYFLDYSYYKEAGANVFINKELEKAYFHSLDVMAKEGVNYYFNDSALEYTQVTYKDLRNTGNAKPAAVPSEMMAVENQFQDAVNKMNAKIAALK